MDVNNNTYVSTKISPNSTTPHPYISLPSCLLSGQLPNLFPVCHLYLLLLYYIADTAIYRRKRSIAYPLLPRFLNLVSCQ